jgi:riboflavin biosynthesis pyrimidine reductase
VRALLPEVLPAADIHAFYAADWLETGGLRANFIASADGAVSAGGKSRGLQTPWDNRVFAALRDLADVVLAGAGTVVTEGYGAVRVGERRDAVRRAYGLGAGLPIAVVSRTLRLDPVSPLFQDAPPDARTIVLTCAAAGTERRRALLAVADVVDCGDETVDPMLARAALAERGLRRMLCEGGPTVLADFTGAGAVDELCLTISPLLTGPGPGRITAGPQWLRTLPLRLTGLLEEDGALFCRYRVGAPPTS